MPLITTEHLRALNTGLVGVFKNALEKAQSDYEKVASVVPSSKASNTYSWLGDNLSIREWIGDRQIQNLEEYDFVIKNKEFEGTVGLKRKDIEDDEVGKYTPLIENLAYSAKTLPDKLIFSLLKNGTTSLCYDKQYFFDTDHLVNGKSVSNFASGSSTPWYLLNTSRPIKPFIWQNRKTPQLVIKDDPKDEANFMRGDILYGVDFRGNAGYGLWQMAYCSKKELTTANFNEAYSAMSSITAQNGEPLNNRPTLLVVPPTLRALANEIITSDKLSSGVTNPNKGIVAVLDTPWLI